MRALEVTENDYRRCDAGGRLIAGRRLQARVVCAGVVLAKQESRVAFHFLHKPLVGEQFGDFAPDVQLGLAIGPDARDHQQGKTHRPQRCQRR